MNLTKEECLKTLNRLKEIEVYGDDVILLKFARDISLIEQLINEHFELVEKATPKKLIVESSGDFNGVPVYDEYYCPTCGMRVDDTDHHCECGQRLEWE